MVQQPQARVTIEIIALAIAKEFAEKAKAEQDDWQSTNSLGASLAMQDHAFIVAVTSVTALEGFINVAAEENLPAKIWEDFERLELKKKWRMLLYIMSRKQWDEGHQPFQDFSQLISLRNSLVHYKPEYESIEKFEANDLELEKKLTGDNALRWYECARQMIMEFYAKAGWEVPSVFVEEDYSIRAEVQFR